MSTLDRCFKYLKTKYTKAAKEVPKTQADEENKAVVPPLGFRVS